MVVALAGWGVAVLARDCVGRVVASRFELARWYGCAGRAGLSFSGWARRALDEAASLEEAEAALVPDRVARIGSQAPLSPWGGVVS